MKFSWHYIPLVILNLNKLIESYDSKLRYPSFWDTLYSIPDSSNKNGPWCWSITEMPIQRNSTVKYIANKSPQIIIINLIYRISFCILKLDIMFYMLSNWGFIIFYHFSTKTSALHVYDVILEQTTHINWCCDVFIETHTRLVSGQEKLTILFRSDDPCFNFCCIM